MNPKKTDIIILEARKKLKMTQKDLADKNVKYLVEINVLENGQVAKIDNTKIKIKIVLPEDLKNCF